MMATKRGLGKGIGVYFGEDVIQDEKDERSGTSNQLERNEDVSRETFLKISLIEPNREQPRKMFQEEQLQELADSIRQYGVLQPLIVHKKNDYYEIITGERRWRAAKIAGIKEVPVVIREYSKQLMMEIALIENLQREDLNPIEEAKAYQALMQEFALKQDEIAERVSKNRVTITNSLRLLKLDVAVQEMLIQGFISSGHARALLSLTNPQNQLKLAQKIIQNKLSVRDVEKAVKAIERPNDKKKKENPESEAVQLVFQNLEERMKSIMGTKVSINKRDKNKGRIEIEYYSTSELERIVELLETIQQ